MFSALIITLLTVSSPRSTWAGSSTCCCSWQSAWYSTDSGEVPIPESPNGG